jgi:hypothetical protein
MDFNFKSYDASCEDIDELNMIELQQKAEDSKFASKVKFSPLHYLKSSLKLNGKEVEKTVVFRPLPITTDEGKSVYFVKVPVHVIKHGNSYPSHICLRHINDLYADGKKKVCAVGIDHLGYGNDCPFCEMESHIRADAENVLDKDEKKAFWKRAFSFGVSWKWVMRGIERGKEDEGVKWWRFSDSKETNHFNTIMNLYSLRKRESEQAGRGSYNIFSIERGKDLNIFVKKVVKSDGKEIDEISSITDSSIETPIAKDPETMKKWLSDEVNWYDVYVPHKYEANVISANGGTPKWNNELKRYVNYDEYERIVKAGGTPVFDEKKNDYVDESEFNKTYGIVPEDQKIRNDEKRFTDVDALDAVNSYQEDYDCESDSLPF